MESSPAMERTQQHGDQSVGFQNLPVEMVEEIFSYLEQKDLSQCNLVCKRWRAIIDNNHLWKAHAIRVGVETLRWLDEETSCYTSPKNKYPSASMMYLNCRWKDHVLKYCFLKNNWRNRNLKIHTLNFTPRYMNSQILVERRAKQLVFWEPVGIPIKLCTSDVGEEGNYESMIANHNYFVFARDREIFFFKRDANEFKQVGKITRDLDIEEEDGTRSEPFKPTLKISEKHVLVQNSFSRLNAELYDCSTGKGLTKISFPDLITGNSFHADLIGQRLLLVVENFSNTQLLLYDYNRTTDNTDWTIFIPEYYGSFHYCFTQKYLAFKCNQSPRYMCCYYKVYDFTDARNVRKIFKFRSVACVLVRFIFEDTICWHNGVLLKLRRFGPRPLEVGLDVSPRVMHIVPAWNDWILVHSSDGIGLWDWKEQERLNTVIRLDYVPEFVASPTNIVVEYSSNKFLYISYW